MSKRVLALFAKAPLPGRVKTRLTPPYAPAEAAKLYEAMLLDILDQHRGAPGLDLVVWYTPDDGREWFEREASGYRLLPQRGADLGERMAALFRVHQAEGYDRVVLRGTDSPTLPPDRVERAFDRLDRADLVISPDLDGGYNLIGMREPCDALFSLEMSRESVLRRTLDRAAEAGRSCELLPEHYDVDTAADVERMRPDLTEDRTPRTLHWLRSAR